MSLIIFLVVLLVVLVGFPALAWYFLAPTNRWFTFVKEGTAKVIVKGDAFSGALIQYEGRTFEHQSVAQNKWDVVEGKESHWLGGFRLYGFWPLHDIYIYKFRWSGVAEDGRIIRKEEWLDYIILKDDIYWAKVERCEDKNLLPLDIELLLTIQVVNPYKALFNIQNWLEAVVNRIKPFVRGYITQDEFNNLIAKKEELGGELMSEFERIGLLSEFFDWYGARVKKVEVKEINPPENYREKTLAPYLAEMEKKAVVIRADGEGERIEKVFSRIEKFGDLGKLIRTLEAAEKSPLAASLTVQAVPGLQEALKGVFGKPPETISSEEFRKLRETVESLVKKMEGEKK